MDEMGNTAAELNYYALLAKSDQFELKNCEVSLVHVGFGVFTPISKLSITKYAVEVNAHDGKAWKQEVEKENKQMVKNKIRACLKFNVKKVHSILS